MVDKILIDTNVLLDYLLEREPFFEDAKKDFSQSYLFLSESK